jgi:hypothetical protein
MTRKTYKSERIRHRLEDKICVYLDEDNNPIYLPDPPTDSARLSNSCYTEEYYEWLSLRKEAIKKATYMADIPVGLGFAALNCRDYESVFSSEMSISWGYTEQPKNKAVIAIARHEYMTKLRALQKEIDEKYGDMLEPENSTVAPSNELAKKAEEAEKENFFDLYDP